MSSRVVHMNPLLNKTTSSCGGQGILFRCQKLRRHHRMAKHTRQHLKSKFVFIVRTRRHFVNHVAA